MGTFEDVYRLHVHAVFRFAVSLVGRRDVAEDLTSEAFLALYRNFDGIDQGQLPAWLITVVRNRALDWWRHREVEMRYADEIAAQSSTTSPAPRLERWILDSADLNPAHRTCLILRYGHGMTRQEIADQTGFSETQVKGYLQYALALLRKALEVGQEA
jgi:RNA polymerase sigma-70 factor (ECF subfamily)